MLHVQFVCRAVKQDDLEAGKLLLAVTSAVATLGGSGGVINGSTDTAEMVLDGLSAALDLAFTVTPTTVHAAGTRHRCCSALGFTLLTLLFFSCWSSWWPGQAMPGCFSPSSTFKAKPVPG